MNQPLITCSQSDNDLALALARNQLGMRLTPQEFAVEQGVPLSDLVELASNEYFMQMVAEYKHELEKDHEGIRLKSAIALEDSIPTLHRMVNHPATPPAAIVSGVKQLADMAGVTKTEKGPTGTGFSINIDLTGLREVAAQMDEQDKGKNVIEIQADRDEDSDD